MEKDQTFPLFDYDKPGADPDEADFEDDSEEFWQECYSCLDYSFTVSHPRS